VQRTLIAIALVVGGCTAHVAGETGAQSEQKGRATDFTLDSIDGKTVHLSDHLGKDVVLLSFWATWCGPCINEMPKLEAIYKKYQPQGFQVLSISMDGQETASQVEPTARRVGVTYPVLLDLETRVVALYNPARDAPFTVLIGKDGKIADKFVGYSPGDERKLEEQIKTLVAAQAQ